MADKPLTQRGAGDPARGAIERADLSAKGAGWTIAALAGVVAVVLGGVFALLSLGFGSVREPGAGHPVQPQGPHLQINERADRAAIDARAEARLAGRGGGLSIDQAMRETARLGWDAPR